MLQSFKNFISDQRLFSHEHTLLLALSGGADSVCLFHLLLESGYRFGVAHCNFKLRGEESDGDEQFIIELAREHYIPYHTMAFDTRTISLVDRTGIQETARKLRYDWFLRLMEEHGYYKVLTAHHQTDNLETMVINILRNTGIKGLHGIPLDENRIARPLLFTNRDTIESYLKERKLAFREDKSNSSNDYLRNELRHIVLPGLKGIQGDAERSFFETARKVKSYEDIANELIAKLWEEIIFYDENAIKIDRGELDLIENKIPFLFYNMQSYGFTFSQIENIVQAKQIGKKVLSESFQLSVERDYYLLQTIKQIGPIEEIIIDSPTGPFTISNMVLIVDMISNPGNLYIKKRDRLFLNADTFDFPVRIRAWKDGDKLKPLGMSGYKKVSDILTDRKVENHLRKLMLVVEKSDNEVIALLPDMIHDDYKVNPETNRIMAIGIKIVTI